MKLVSILFPVYNAEKYLEECLDSILWQTHEYWELIAVDDYSTDNSLDILLKYKLKDSRIRVFKNPNTKGIIPALQFASSHIQGDCVTRMDADDIMPSQKLEWLTEGVGSKKIVTGLVEYFSEEGNLGLGFKRYETWVNSVLSSTNPWSHLFEECVIPSPAWMMKRGDFEVLGGFEQGQYPEDYDFCFRLYQAGFKIEVCPRVVHLWRDHRERSSRQLAVYADQNFFRLKIYYLKALGMANKASHLLLWGAGRKGKNLASLLKVEEVNFVWSCGTPSKWGHYINGIKIETASVALERCRDGSVIIAVSGPADKVKVKSMLSKYFKPDQCYSFY